MAVDALLAAALVAVFVASYTGGLGFYSDDWAFLDVARHAPGGSFPAVFRALEGGDRTLRVVQYLAFAAEYVWFGFGALGYHVVSGALVVATVAGFALALGRLGVSRPVALAAALAFGFCPNASTARFWTAVPVYLSLALYLLSLHAGLSVRDGAWRRASAFGAAALVAEAASAFTYEVPIPLFFANAALYARRGGAARRLAGWTIPLTIALAAAKAAFSTRSHAALDFGQHVQMFVAGVTDSVTLNVGEFVVALPLVAADVRPWLRGIDVAAAASAGLGAAAFVAWATWRADLPDRASARTYAIWAVVLFGLGYAVFAPNAYASFSATGVANRTALAASLGISLGVAGVVAFLTTALPGRPLRAVAYGAVVGAYCACGAATIGGNAAAWRIAAARQIATADDVADRLRRAPDASWRSTAAIVLVSGVCPYVGSGVVMESRYDASVLLGSALDRDDFHADIVSSTTRVFPEAVRTNFYIEQQFYPLARPTFGYDAASGTVTRLADAGAARRFVDRGKTELRSCGTGVEGNGVTMLPEERARLGY